MKKILTIIFFSFFYLNSSYGDQPFEGVQINCYEESGYFEMRNIITSNLNKFGAWEDENLISIHIPGEADKENYGSIIKECKFLPQRAIENEITIKVILYPYCYMLSKIKEQRDKCIVHDVKFDLWHIDNKGEKLIFDKTSFFIFEKSYQQIERVEYLPKDLYFTVHLKYRKNQTRKYLGDRFFSDEDYNFKEINLWLPGSVSSSEEKYPVTNKLFQKMYK